MLVKSDLTSKDTSLWSSGVCTVLIASMKLSVNCSLCRDWRTGGSLVEHRAVMREVVSSTAAGSTLVVLK